MGRRRARHPPSDQPHAKIRVAGGSAEAPSRSKLSIKSTAPTSVPDSLAHPHYERFRAGADDGGIPAHVGYGALSRASLGFRQALRNGVLCQYAVLEEFHDHLRHNRDAEILAEPSSSHTPCVDPCELVVLRSLW